MKYTTNEGMTVDIPASEKFVSGFIAHLRFREKASEGEELVDEKICQGGHALVCILTFAFALPSCSCITCHFLGAGLRFYISFLLLLLEK